MLFSTVCFQDKKNIKVKQKQKEKEQVCQFFFCLSLLTKIRSQWCQSHSKFKSEAKICDI